MKMVIKIHMIIISIRIPNTRTCEEIGCQFLFSFENGIAKKKKNFFFNYERVKGKEKISKKVIQIVECPAPLSAVLLGRDKLVTSSATSSSFGV